MAEFTQNMPCRFCGSKSHRLANDSSASFVVCTICYARGPREATDHQAMASWIDQDIDSRPAEVGVMNSFQSEIGRAFREGAARTRDDMDELEREEDAYVLANVDRIRRAAVVEAIRGVGLEWGHGCAYTEFGTYYLDAGEWWLGVGPVDDIRDDGTGGKAGALADYRARVASMFENQFPGIGKEVCGE